MKMRCFVVTLDMPSGVSVNAMKDYIRSWVASGKGSLHPADPLFHLDGDSVRVTAHIPPEPMINDDHVLDMLLECSAQILRVAAVGIPQVGGAQQQTRQLAHKAETMRAARENDRIAARHPGSTAQDKPLSSMAERAKGRPKNFDSLSPREQWDVDKRLGILDWDGT